MKNDLKISVDNSIRSLFQMIACVTDENGECIIIDHNREIGNISDGGTGRFEDLRRSLTEHTHPEDREALMIFTGHDLCVETLKTRVHSSMECRLRHTDGRYCWSEIIICNTTAEDSTQGNDFLLLIRDIDERKTCEIDQTNREQAVIKKLKSQYDALFEENMTDQQTGCYNRKGLKYYSDIVIDDALKNGRDLFVCVADLNGLKYLNDTYGHAAGDEAIAAVSTILKASAPSGSKTVRIGGDEFLIFAAVKKDSDEPGKFADRVDTGLAAYNEAHPNPFTVGASYGWVLLPAKEGMTGLDEYIGMADARMYEMRIVRDRYRRE
ncbi:MAG: diguanylate cyclase [Lachnospiraceae bacterium]|nr:diguanylate cyclase [Lachnospiraceae bacterium]